MKQIKKLGISLVTLTSYHLRKPTACVDSLSVAIWQATTCFHSFASVGSCLHFPVQYQIAHRAEGSNRGWTLFFFEAFWTPDTRSRERSPGLPREGPFFSLALKSERFKHVCECDLGSRKLERIFSLYSGVLDLSSTS